ncbi:MAG: molecular chaperone HtpG [Candidatus Margulisbacteria bacterium]|nr:molecular chaperone HtpG [Candidatus Margulisiibacteriota bacterium]
MPKSQMEKFEFKTEVKQLLELVIHSLYSHKDIFLRELISNAADAIDRLRFESLTDTELKKDNKDNIEWKIKLVRDEKQRTLTISDNGIGMTHDELVDHLGTIAKSGTKTFLEQLKKIDTKQDLSLIGQFGVGFYSSFMVADKVTVVSRHAKSDTANKWVSDGEGGFQVEPANKSEAGTDVILHLKDDAQDYLQEHQLRDIVKKYSDFVEHPIVIDVEKEEKLVDQDNKTIKKKVEETLNSRKALWAKAKNEIKDEEYIEFYKHLAHDLNPPLKTIHYSAEGTIEFKALIYIPQKAPFDLFFPDSIKGIHLYVKRIFIMDDCKKLIPEYLRFVKGVVDANDLPLNVSREILQQDAALEKIKKNVVNKILQTLQTMLDKEYDEYVKFYREFGKVLKEGIHYDYENKDKILELCLYETSKTGNGEFKSLKQYVENMPKDQKDIYYIIAENKAAAMMSPHLEIFKKKDLEVLVMTDTIDEWVLGSVFEYKGKKLKAVDKGDLSMADKDAEKEIKEKKEQYTDLLSFMQKELEQEVKEVTFSARLTDSPSCLVLDESGMSKQMEQMFKAMGQDVPAQKKILEINASHPIVEVMQKIFSESKENPVLKDYVQLLYDQAVLAEGGKIKDPLQFVKKISELMIRAAK